jgi:hypothetical protein
VEVAQALAELTELSSQIERAVVGSTLPDADRAEALARAARELIAVGAELHASGDVTRVEVELAEGAMFVLREAGRTIAATTGPSPTAGLVVYDLRTCLHGLGEPKPKRRQRKKQADA